MILTNCTDSPRGIALKQGIVMLKGREMREVPEAEQAEIRALFKNKTFQRFVDNGIFRLSEMGADEASVKVKTKPSPSSLEPAVKKDSLQTTVGTKTGSKAKEPVVVEHQAGGPLSAPAGVP